MGDEEGKEMDRAYCDIALSSDIIHMCIHTYIQTYIHTYIYGPCYGDWNQW